MRGRAGEAPAGPDVLVYQMGKVGSTSIVRSLRAAGAGEVVQTHSHDLARELIAARRPGRTITLITGVREPLARCISAFFQNLTHAHNRWWYFGDRDAVLAAEFETLRAHFDTCAGAHVDGLLAPWFGTFRAATGVGLDDFEETPEGCWHAACEGLELYAYRLEELAALEAALTRSGRFGTLAFGRENEGEQKAIAEKYRDFRTRYRIADADYDRLYGAMDWVRRFYTPDELRSLTARYRGP